MIRKIKTLGLATIAVLAMSAFVASAAQAQFTSNAYPTTVTATSALGNDVLTVDGTSVECKNHYEGTLTEASESLSLVVTATECKAFGFVSATVTKFNCERRYRWYGPLAWEKCEKEIIHGGNCTIEILQQNGLISVSFTNSGTNINMQANVSGITVNVAKDGFLCPLNGTGHKTATYKQSSAVALTPVSGGTDLTVD